MLNTPSIFKLPDSTGKAVASYQKGCGYYSGNNYNGNYTCGNFNGKCIDTSYTPTNVEGTTAAVGWAIAIIGLIVS